MRFFPLLREILKDVVVPIAVSGLAAYATIKAAQAENLPCGDGDGAKSEDKDDPSGKSGPDCCCGCMCRSCRQLGSEQPVERKSADGKDDQVGGSGGGERPPSNEG